MGRINLQRQQSWLITVKLQCCLEKRLETMATNT